jgi:hypothetical protein
MTFRARLASLAVIALLSALFAMAYAIRAGRNARALDARPTGVVFDDARLVSLRSGPHVLFRTTRVGEGYGRMVAVSPDDPAGPRSATELECDRLDMAGGAGLCLFADRGLQTDYWAVIFDAGFQRLHTVRLAGIPSRTRVSPDGRLAAVTVFVSGHSYAQGAFSTQTTIIDTNTGRTLGDLESFEVLLDGKPFKKIDFNFWGVTFARDSNTFYATLGSGSDLYLVRGDARARRAEVIARGVECPSLSPDNTRLAFKRRTTSGGRLIWRLALLDLATGEQRLIDGETRSVDDQVEWLDDARILYALPDETEGRSGTSVWVVDVAAGASELWADGAFSPSVVTP